MSTALRNSLPATSLVFTAPSTHLPHSTSTLPPSATSLFFTAPSSHLPQQVLGSTAFSSQRHLESVFGFMCLLRHTFTLAAPACSQVCFDFLDSPTTTILLGRDYSSFSFDVYNAEPPNSPPDSLFCVCSNSSSSPTATATFLRLQCPLRMQQRH